MDLAICNTPEWKAIHLRSRAEILLVSQGFKKATQVHAEIVNRFSLEKIFESPHCNLVISPRTKRGTEYTIAQDSSTLKNYLTIRNKIMDKWGQDIRSCPVKEQNDKQWHWNGKLLNELQPYENPLAPQCCIDYTTKEFAKGMKGKVTKAHSHLWKEINANNNSYPEEFNYLMLHVKPCNLNCQKAIDLGAQIKNLFQQYDPEIANWMRYLGKEYHIGQDYFELVDLWKQGDHLHFFGKN